MAEKMDLLSLSDIFSIYPKVFNELIIAEELQRSREGALLKDFLYLPSDAVWQEKVYYRLLEVQKRVNDTMESGITPDEFNRKKDKPIWDPKHILRSISPISPTSFALMKRKKCASDLAIRFIDIALLASCSLNLIAKAGSLLAKPPIAVEFADEHQMRNVYSLIYDVFRYKNVLHQALTDISFFERYPTLLPDKYRVWLLSFDLYCRQFLKRTPQETDAQEKLFKEANLEHILILLTQHRVPLAASLSRLRINNGALTLSQLLPSHLQDEKVAIAAANPIITGWMNPFRIKNRETAEGYLAEMGLTEVAEPESGSEHPMKLNQYKWDKVCPLFISCIPEDREKFTQSDVVRNNCFIIQDRQFSLAPAIFPRLLDHFELDGDIVQTHISSLRSTAYLAALFFSISNRVNDFLAFGAGPNLAEYKHYFELLGVTNVRLFAENFCRVSLEATVLETVVGAYVSPPNSFSGVRDPIDLICSRGGDLSMLEILTESEISNQGKIRVAQLLEEQRETLRLAMSRPQVQFVLYETHSIVDSENHDMAEKAVEGINRSALEKHVLMYKEKKKIEIAAEMEAATPTPSAAFTPSSPRRRVDGTLISSATTEKSNDLLVKINKFRYGSASSNESDAAEDTSQKLAGGTSTSTGDLVKVPKTDEFLMANVPDVCMNQDKCIDFQSVGCFVSLMHRKQITRLNAKYLIQMAEARGLFGNAEHVKNDVKITIKPESQTIKAKDDDQNASKRQSKKNDISALIRRINKPTHASIHRAHFQRISSAKTKVLAFNFERKTCSRCNKNYYQEQLVLRNSDPHSRSLQEEIPAKRWWQETAQYLKILRDFQKFYLGTEKHFVCSLHGIQPVLPPLSLTKISQFSQVKEKLWKKLPTLRNPFPVALKVIELDDYYLKPAGYKAINNNYSGYWTN